MNTWLMDRRVCFLGAVLALVPLDAAGQSGGGGADGQGEQAVDAPTRKLVAAHGLFQRGLFKLASQEYADFLKENPSHPQRTAATYALALCEYRQNDFERAASLLAGVVKDAGFAQRVEALAVLGHCELAQKRYDKAVAAFDELLSRDPKGAQAEAASINRAQALYLSGKHQEAEAACAAFARDYPKSAQRPAALYFEALSQFAQRKHAETVATAEGLLRESPETPFAPDAMLVAGQALEAQGKLAEAVERYRRMAAAAAAGRKGDGYYSMGVALYKAGEYDEAIKALSQVEGGAYLKASRLQLGLALLAANRIGEARATLGSVVREGGDNGAAARYGLARCDMAERKFESARDTLRQLLAGKPANAAQIALDEGTCLMEMGKYDEAVLQFSKLATAQPTAPQAAEALYRQAFCLHKLSKFDASHDVCVRLVAARSTELAGPVAELDAENLFALGKHAEAAGAFDALARDVKDEQRMLRLKLRVGQCAYFGGDYAKAVELLSPLAGDPRVSAAPELASAIFLLGDALLQQGKNAPAADALAKFVGVAKGDQSEAKFKLGLARLRGNDAQGARAVFADLSRGPDASPWVQRGLVEYGQLLLKESKGSEAMAALRRVISAKAPDDLSGSATYLLGWADFDAKRFREAAQSWNELVENYPKHPLATDAAYQRGVALKEAGAAADAATALQQFAAAHPESPNAARAKQLAAICLSAQGKAEEATAVLASLAIDPKAGDGVLYDLAWAQRAQKKDAQAVETYRRLLKDHPDSKLVQAARTELAEFLYNGKEYDEAARLLEAVVAADGADAKLRSAAAYRLGWCYQKLGKPDQAAAAFEKCDPKEAADEGVAASALLQAAMAYAETKRFDKAEGSLVRVLKDYPHDSQGAVGLLKLGEVQAELGKYEESARTYATFLEKHPKSEFASRAHFGIGWADENRRKFDDARVAYKKAIDASTGETAARAQFQIGETFLAEGKFEQGIPALLAVEDVYAYPKWSARALFEAGRAFEELKQSAEARKQYEAVVAKYKDAPEAALAKERLKHVGG
jgi:TolA-binding protein